MGTSVTCDEGAGMSENERESSDVVGLRDAEEKPGWQRWSWMKLKCRVPLWE